jgi:glucokinase
VSAAFVGLDVGGTFLKGALVSGEGEVRARLHQPTARDSAEALLSQLASATAQLEAGSGPAAGVGVGLPGIVNRRTGKLYRPPNLPAIDGIDAARELGRRTGRPSVAENDANAAALAEAWKGAGRDAVNVLLVTLGTGIGGGIVLGGRIWEGTSGYAGEVGHVQVDPGGVRCGCGSWGCVETYAGAPGWARRARQALERAPESRLHGMPLDPAAIVEAARAGDQVALGVVEETAAALGAAIGGALNVLNLDRVVLAGGVAAAGAFLLDRIVEQTRRRVFPHVFADCSFRLAELGGDAGVVGAARAAMIALAPA